MNELRQPAIAAAGVLLLAGAVLTGCLEQPNPITPTDVEPVVIPDFAITDLRLGAGVAAATGNFLTVEFTLWLYDQSQPDEKGQQVTTTVGDPSPVQLDPLLVIAGWIQGLVGMREGGLRRLVIPPALAFGAAGSLDGAVPPNTSVVYEIDLLTVDEAPDFTITDLLVGTGAEATDGKTLSVEYVGWAYDPTEPENKGTQFDASGGTPIGFVLGAGQVIPGWDQGFVGMRVGGERQLIIPPELAYGVAGFPASGILPNATLVFDIELVAVE